MNPESIKISRPVSGIAGLGMGREVGDAGEQSCECKGRSLSEEEVRRA